MNIRVVRESGGLGDIVRILPAIRGLREAYPEAQIDVFVPQPYACLVERAGDCDRIVHTPANRRARLSALDEKQWPYLHTDVVYDLNVDLYCPAYRYEADARGNVWHDRIELFCKATGAWPKSLTPRIPITDCERNEARNYLIGCGVPEKRGWIAVQPHSTDPARDWPHDRWKLLADMLAMDGFGVFTLDSFAGRTRDFPVPQFSALPLIALGAILSCCKLLIGPDSGLAHLSGAVGGRALGLTASQSGAVLYRHYPNHSWISPDWDGQTHCRWPCFWTRPRECQRHVLRTNSRTCAQLARISVEAVFDEVVARAEATSRIPSASVLSCVSAELPTGCIRAMTLPIPMRDFSVEAVAVDAGSTVVASAREAFRVLRPGGHFYAGVLDQDDAREILRAGFALDESGAFVKVGTYPRWAMT